MNFFFYYLVTIWSDLTSFLLNRRVVRIDLELVNHNIWADASHVLVRQSEVVVMLLKELDESKAEVEPELGANLNFVIWKIRMNADII